MLSERQLEELLKVFERRMQSVTEDYIRRMGEHIREIGQLTPTDVHRLTQMKRVNANIEAVKREIARAADAGMRDIEAVFRAAAESDQRFAETVFAEDHTPTVKTSPVKTLSSPLERILKAQLRVTAQEMANLSRTTLVSEAYRNAVDVAVQMVQSGVTDYTSAIRSAMKEAAKEGLRVQYPSGLTRRLDTAIRQNVLDGIRALNQDVLRQVGKEYGSDGVEISAHALCAEDHLPYQGLQFSNKEFDRLQNLLNRPFGLWNCKHTVFPILLGITEPAHTLEQLQQYRIHSTEEITIGGVTKSRYEWTQAQRRIETAIREQKYIANAAKAAGDPVARRQAQATINRLDEEYTRISEAAGLYQQRERMAVAGFRRVKAADPSERARLAREYTNVVPIKALDAPGYVELFDGITDNPTVNNSIYNAAVEILTHRNGTYKEDLYIIDGDTGETILAITGSTGRNSVSYDQHSLNVIKNARNNNRKMIAIHNHPTGTPPTMDDGASAYSRGYDLGVVVGHNLDVYTYTATNGFYDADACKEVHDLINQVIAMGVDFDEDVWYNNLAKFGMNIRRVNNG